ncbi:hypothetical protein [Pimelobacter sp. 30-1]|uniref:hypothetical protein n=1 Tax=Pimelobacter sp. 30-1 TaxID=2004991 RepID=UPI001C048329|nr:hypothetical protein [Pimelobacter sp. 30-1]MBU2698151.1 hypothetical protein [Pimelobacter sp. 30-1]
MRSPHAALLAVLLSVTLAACGGTDSTPEAKATAESPSPAPPAAALSDVDGVAAQSGFAMGADVASFCTAMQDADDTVDGARPGNTGDWQEVLTALDKIYEVGVPEDFPPAALTELDTLDRLVRQSKTVDQLAKAAKKEQVGTSSIDDYLTSACTG